MRTLIAIPARYASTRYPGKPLVALRGPDGEKTLIRRSWEAAIASRASTASSSPPMTTASPTTPAPSGPRW